MRRVTDEAPQTPLRRRPGLEGRLDLLHHLVERESEPPDLGVLVDDVDAL